MEKTVGYAVVGLGVGRNHVKAAAKAEGGKLVAICDLREERLQAQAELYPGAVSYTHLRAWRSCRYSSAGRTSHAR